MNRVLMIYTLDMNSDDKFIKYVEAAKAILKEKNYEFEFIQIPIRYDSKTVIEQIVALELLDLPKDISLYIAIGDMSGFVGEGDKIILADKNFIALFEEDVQKYICNIINKQKKHCVFLQDIQEEDWERELVIRLNEMT